MRLLAFIAFKHLLARKRQSVVSLSGIVLGVAFFLAISSLMQGSQNDFIKRLVDNSPHITISDEFRAARRQPAEMAHPDALVEIRNVKPLTETRGIRGYEQVIAALRAMPGTRAAAIQQGQAIVTFAGQDIGVTLSGMVPADVRDVTTIQEYMVQGSVDELIVNPGGIIIGEGLARKFSVRLGDNINVASPTGQLRAMKVVGIFRTGREGYDLTQTFVDIKKAQALLERPHRANSIIIKIPDPYAAREVAAELENRYRYKAVSWQESSEDLMNTLAIRNIIMYTVVSAVLVVAAFGIYNVISTVVMEKHRDIAILKSMGFLARDVQRIFVVQGLVLGCIGCLLGLPLGAALMYGLMQISLKPPGSTEAIYMPISWDAGQFGIATAFALGAALVASVLPARKAAKVEPVDILRGGAV